MCRKCDSYQGHHQAINAHRNNQINLLENNMANHIGLFWLKDDFRIKKNSALIEATKNHSEVVVFFLYKKKKFEEQEAQKWWLGKSLEEFKNKLIKYNINLEIINVESYQSFFKSFKVIGFICRGEPQIYF